MTERFENDPFAGEGEVRELCRATDWSATSVGPVEEWSPALRTSVRTCLASPFPIALWCGSELNLIYNDAYIQVLGDKHPAIGRPGKEVWSEIWEDIGPMFEQIRAGGPPAYAEDAPFVVRRAGAGADGHETDRSDADSGRAGPNAWFTFALSPVRDATGEIAAMLNIVFETTARVLAERETRAARSRAEQAEERLVEIFTHAPAFMAVVRGPDHVFEYVNASYYQLVGHRDLIGLPVREALPEIRGQGFEELLDQVVRTGVPFVGRETPVLLARVPGEEPEEHFLDFVYYPITESDGGVTGVVAHGSDVTEHVRSRNEAQRARVEAEEANRAKSKFLANMSHEIRTPINAIMGYTDLLELGTAGPLNEKQRDQLERVRASSHHLLTLVNDILDVAKVEAGRMEIDIAHASAADAAAAAIALVRPQASDRGIRLEDRCTRDPAATYSGDENRVRQILVNLLSNAIKFTDPGGQVVVECGSAEVKDVDLDVDAEGPFTFIRVTDTGIGIEPEAMEKVFQPFTQIDDGHTRSYGGTGLGLTISRQLARMMGGDFTVQSVPGEGSTFTLWLPSEPAPEDEPLFPDTATAPPRHLAQVGQALQDRLLEVLHWLDERLRAHPQIPGAADLSDADLEDHASSFLADIAQSLIALEKGEAVSSQLLKDGSEIQRVIAELHGRQRALLGWSREALAAEWSVLLEEMHSAVRSGLPEEADADDALDVMTRFVDRAKRISIRSHRHMTQTM